jgi:hypothetical protein
MTNAATVDDGGECQWLVNAEGLDTGPKTRRLTCFGLLVRFFLFISID